MSAGPLPPFGGEEARPVEPGRARLVLLPVPYERTATYRRGTAAGPAAILDASRQVELYDEEVEFDLAGAGVATLPPLTSDGMPDTLADLVEPVVRRHLDGGRIVGCLGGEHSVSLGAIRAAARYQPGLGILQIDAHPDLRDEYEGTRFGHGCVMRRALDLPEVGRLVQVGLRAISPEDAAAMRERRVRSFLAHQLRGRAPAEWAAAAVDALPEAVYVSFDLDGLDPSVIPGTGTPEPGGLSWWDALALLRLVAARRRIIAFDVVELLPEPPSRVSDFAAARLVMKLVAYLLGPRR
ncbi:MAG: agmatinase [Planctomycetota bacterium]